MKKVVIILAGGVLTLGLILMLRDGEQTTPAVSPTKQNNQEPARIVPTEERATDTVSNNLPLEETPTKTSESEETLTCSERYRKQPEWKEIEAILSSIYLNGEEAAGKGVYQQIPIEAVKSYADAGDVDALFHYGSEKMWKAAFGVHMNAINRNVHGGREELKRQVQQHKPDMKRFYAGAEYSYQAAVRGKYGGIMEVSFLSRTLLRRMVKSGVSIDDIKDALVQRHAYLNLMREIHKYDSELLSLFSASEEFKKDMVLIFEDKDLPAEFTDQVKVSIDEQSKVLLQSWKNDRARLGLVTYPDVIPERLEAFLRSMERECG